jgi:hypothetical protein
MPCDECGGTGMWDVLSSVPCPKCMDNKANIALLIKQIITFKLKAVKDCRWSDAGDFRKIEDKLRKKLKK